jgi:hypothetical protein
MAEQRKRPQGDQPADNSAEPTASPAAPAQDGEHAPVQAAPTREELEQALDATPEAQAAAEAQQAAADDAEAAPELVRLVPADWSVDAVEFPYGDAAEGDEQPRLTVSQRGYEVAADQADDIIAAAGSHGFALRKESVA